MNRMNKTKNKKGELSKVAEYILLIVAGIILIAVFAYILMIGRSTSDTEACRLSVLAKSVTSVNIPFSGQTDSSVFDLNCKTDFITLYDNRIIKNDIIREKLDEKTAEAKVKRAIANEMYDCWYQMGAGNVDLFSNYKGSGAQNHCLVCAYVDFDETFKEQYSSIDNINEMLEKSMPGKKQSYINFLTKGAVDEIPDIPLTMSTEKSGYAIMYWVYKAKKIPFTDVSNKRMCDEFLLGNIFKDNPIIPESDDYGMPLVDAPNTKLFCCQDACIFLQYSGEEQAQAIMVLPTEEIGDKCDIMY